MFIGNDLGMYVHKLLSQVMCNVYPCSSAAEINRAQIIATLLYDYCSRLVHSDGPRDLLSGIHTTMSVTVVTHNAIYTVCERVHAPHPYTQRLQSAANGKLYAIQGR